MADYAYSAQPTRNPFRYAAAVWRLIRRDPAEATSEAAIVEIGFARSRLGRRFARWGETVSWLRREPLAAAVLAGERPFGRIELAHLEGLPHGTLGRVFADHCRARQIDPNLIHVPPEGEVGRLLNHLYQTHDIWHVVTGWGNDLTGEVGLAAFYAAQLGSPAFFGYMLALVLLNVVSRRADLDEILAAFSEGYRTGKQAACIFGAPWDELWETPLRDVRERFALDPTRVVGEGIRAAA
ncbi:MAG: Coq4 family protein [Myxococcota bacterium]|nr:Coq4 family protein [Myxococcota bacterium]